MQEQISDSNVQRHLLSLSVRNLDRKINIIIKSRKMQLEGRIEEEESVEQEARPLSSSSSIIIKAFTHQTNTLRSTRRCFSSLTKANSRRTLWGTPRRCEAPLPLLPRRLRIHAQSRPKLSYPLCPSPPDRNMSDFCPSSDPSRSISRALFASLRCPM